MSFQGMGDLSSDEVLFLRSGAKRCSTPPPVSHRHDESQPPIPQRVGLHRSPPPLQRPVSSSRQPAGNVNLHPNWVGEFSPGEMRNFHPALTLGAPVCFVPRVMGPIVRERLSNWSSDGA